MRRWAPILILLAAWVFTNVTLAAAAIKVYPSGDVVPDNLLRISLMLPASPESPVLPQLSLRHCGGETIDSPFLPQELWSPDGRRLTVLMHPGRVKTGLIAEETLGRAITEGDCVELIYQGRSLKRWLVGSDAQVSPDPMRWRITVPRANTKGALVVALGMPIDGADANLIAVEDSRGERLKGIAALDVGETVWSFHPTRPWRHDIYRLRVHPALEDAAGNRVGQTFEHNGESDQAVPSIAISFVVP